ncbi:MAG: hypothetical protein IJU11_07475 [Prevotella sp.]|nr:hypothetical protein [Prevotella sp.]
MKKTILSLLFVAYGALALAQKDSKPFRAYIYNKEYETYLRINLYDQDVSVPGQELYGKLPGYLGKLHNSFCWVITSCRIINEKHAELQLINDFGSEDLTASLTCVNDSTYELRQEKGSALKVPWKGKWRKLPKTLEMIKQ